MNYIYKLAFVFAAIANLSGCSDLSNALDSPEVKMVKEGTLQLCPSHNVEQMVNGFMGSPAWESGESDSGQKFVNIAGDITFHDKPVRAEVQFTIDGNEFTFRAFEMNGVLSENIIAISLLNKMCESAISEPKEEINTKLEKGGTVEAVVEQVLPEPEYMAEEVAPPQDISEATIAASFDCTKASTNIEKQICSSPELSKLDYELSKNYKSTLASNIGEIAVVDLKATQKLWVSTRNQCVDDQCLADEYKKRSNEICDSYLVISGVAPSCITYE